MSLTVSWPSGHALTLGFFCLLQSWALASNAQGQDAQNAQEDGTSRHRLEAPLLPIRIDGHGAITWDGEFGLGGRADIPVINDGFTSGSRDQLCISVGLDVVFVAFE